MGIYQPQNASLVETGARSADALLKPITTGVDQFKKLQNIDKENENKKIVESTLAELRNPNSVMFAGKTQAEKFALVADKLRLIAPDISAKYDTMAKEQLMYERDESKFKQQQTLQRDLNTADNESREAIAMENRLAKASEAGSAGELQQIWKDASRVLAEAIRVNDTVTAGKYKKIVDRAESILAEKSPDLWGSKEGEQVKTEEEKPMVIDDKEIKNLIFNAGDGKKVNGVIENSAQITDAINSWAKKNNLPLNNALVAELKDLLEDRKNTVKAEFDAGIDASQRSKSDARDITALEKSYKAPYNAQERLKANPSDVTNKRTVLNLNLRTETGAVIGADEFEGMMSTVLPANVYNDFKKEITGLSATLLGMTNKDLQERYLKGLVEKYLQFVDTNKLLDYTTDKIPEAYLDYRAKKVRKVETKGNEPKIDAKNANGVVFK